MDMELDTLAVRKIVDAFVSQVVELNQQQSDNTHVLNYTNYHCHLQQCYVCARICVPESMYPLIDPWTQ